MGVHQALRDNVRHRVLDGRRGPDPATIRTQAQRALARLEQGLGDYAIRSGGGTPAV
jgi:hypothetical protein